MRTDMELNYKNIFKYSEIPTIVMNQDGYFIDHNSAYQKLFGFKHEDDLKNFHPTFLSPLKQPNGKNSKDESKKHIKKAIKNGKTEFTWLHKNINHVEFLSHVTLEVINYKPQKIIVGKVFEKSINDQIQRKVDEKTKELNRLNKELNAFFNSKSIAILVVDNNRTIVNCNPTSIDFLKYESTEDLIGKNTSIIFRNQDEYFKFGQKYREKLYTGSKFEGEYAFKRKDGEEFWGQVHASLLDNSETSSFDYGTLWIITDITEKKLLQKELHEQYLVAKDANPLTHLPGNHTISSHIIHIIKQKKNVSIIYCDLDNFKAYNDYHGFIKGDLVIQHTAKILTEIQSKYNLENYFVGHIGGDDFVLVIDDAYLDRVTKEIISIFDLTIKNYYSSKDYENHYIISKNRLNKLERIPIMSISMAGVSLKDVRSLNHFQIIDMCTEIKQKCKLENKSNFILNSRVF